MLKLLVIEIYVLACKGKSLEDSAGCGDLSSAWGSGGLSG